MILTYARYRYKIVLGIKLKLFGGMIVVIAISAAGSDMESRMDQRFGRAACFAIIDTETMKYEFLDNAAAAASGGAGISAAQTVADKNVKAVITGNVGPNAGKVLSAAGIEVYYGKDVTVKENAELFKKGSLEKITSSAPRHYGLRG